MNRHIFDDPRGFEDAVDADRLSAATTVLPRINTAASKLQEFINCGGLVSYLGPDRGYRARLFGFAADSAAGAGQAISDWIAQIECRADIF